MFDSCLVGTKLQVRFPFWGCHVFRLNSPTHTSNTHCHSHAISRKSRVEVESHVGWRYHNPKNIFMWPFLFLNSMFFHTRLYFNEKFFWLVSHDVKTFPNTPWNFKRLIETRLDQSSESNAQGHVNVCTDLQRIYAGKSLGTRRKYMWNFKYFDTWPHLYASRRCQQNCNVSRVTRLVPLVRLVLWF